MATEHFIFKTEYLCHNKLFNWRRYSGPYRYSNLSIYRYRGEYQTRAGISGSVGSFTGAAQCHFAIRNGYK